jgi:plastocyanin
MYRSLFSVLALALAADAKAATQIIDVGKGGSLAFSPNSLTAAVGDS